MKSRKKWIVYAYEETVGYQKLLNKHNVNAW